MMMNLRKWFLFAVIGIVWISWINARDKNTPPDNNPTQFEEVTVINTQFPVRVFQNNIPVKDLKKEDFKLFVNDKPKAINAFYQVTKKIGKAIEEQPAKTPNSSPQPRLFVFIFNISDYHMNLARDIDTIFREILRKGDRYMVITNSFFLPETRLADPEKEKQKILSTLISEANKLKMQFLQTEVELKTVAKYFLYRINDEDERIYNTEFPVNIFRDFFREYLIVLDEVKNGYFGMARDQYVKIAEYLKSQDAEKWVLSFYQIGIFPKFKNMGQIQSYINQYADSADNTEVKKLVMNFLPKLDDVDEWSVVNISKLFVNSGATIHTLLIKPVNSTNMDDYDYQLIPTDSESILRKIAEKTGGTLLESITTDEFINQIANQEDVLYMVSFQPDANELKDYSVKLKLEKTGNYRLAYDNQRKPFLLNRIISKFNKDNSRIKVSKLQFLNNTLYAVISNIKTIIPGVDSKEKTGRIEAKIILMDNQSNIVWETTKSFKCKESQSMFVTQLPSLPAGSYDVLVEVKDILNWSTDATGQNIILSGSLPSPKHK